MTILKLIRLASGVILLFGMLTTANASIVAINFSGMEDREEEHQEEHHDSGSTPATSPTVVTRFGGTVGNLGTSHVFGSIIATAFNSSGRVAYLNQRGERNDNGIGVCNTVDDGGKKCFGSGNGVNNEIDNNGSTYDWIRLDVRAVRGRVTSIGLSSLDDHDNYSIWGNNTGIATFSKADFITHGTSSHGVNPNISIASGFGDYGYYFVTTWAQAGSSKKGEKNEKDKKGEKDKRDSDDGKGGDFLLRDVTTTFSVVSVPLPSALPMLGIGLSFLTWRGCKRSKKA